MSTTTSQHRHVGAPWLAPLLLLASLLALALTATAASAAASSCEDELHRITAGGPVDADDAAVLTAQAFDADLDGFALASWDVADDVTLTAVHAVTAEGDLLFLPATDTGTVERVLELRFCGSRGDVLDGHAATSDGLGTSDAPANDTEVLGVQLVASPDRAAAAEAAAEGTRMLEIAVAVGTLLAIGVTTARGRGRTTLGGRR